MRHLLAKIAAMQWAMTPVALDAMWNLASREWTEAQYNIFHMATEETKLAIMAHLGSPISEGSNAFVQGDTGFLLFDGPMIPQATAFSARSNMVAIDQMAVDFKDFEADSSIKRILSLFDSPGGAVTGTGDLAALVRESKKETLGFIYGQAASAAFWVAAQVDELYASPTGVAGSIGILAKIQDPTNPDETVMVSSQAPFKNPDLSTKEGKSSVQVVLDGLADVFIDDVAAGRRVSRDNVLKNFGQGGEVVAAQALSVGMIDKTTTLDKLMSSFNEPPAMGGDARRRSMDLDQYLAENPAAAAAMKQKLSAEYERGKKEAETKNKERAAAAGKFLNADYPSPIKALAAQVVSGEAPQVALTAAAAAYDAMKEGQASAAAAEESNNSGGLQQPAELTGEAKADAEANEINLALGRAPAPLASEVV